MILDNPYIVEVADKLNSSNILPIKVRLHSAVTVLKELETYHSDLIRIYSNSRDKDILNRIVKQSECIDWLKSYIKEKLSVEHQKTLVIG